MIGCLPLYLCHFEIFQYYFQPKNVNLKVIIGRQGFLPNSYKTTKNFFNNNKVSTIHLSHVLKMHYLCSSAENTIFFQKMQMVEKEHL